MAEGGWRSVRRSAFERQQLWHLRRVLGRTPPPTPRLRGTTGHGSEAIFVGASACSHRQCGGPTTRRASSCLSPGRRRNRRGHPDGPPEVGICGAPLPAGEVEVVRRARRQGNLPWLDRWAAGSTKYRQRRVRGRVGVRVENNDQRRLPMAVRAHHRQHDLRARCRSGVCYNVPVPGHLERAE